MIVEEVKTALKYLGVNITRCKKCGQEIFFIPTKNNKMAPVTMELKSHFADCCFAGDFKK